MKVQSRFTFEKINFQQDKDVHLVVGLSAPKTDAQARPTICIVPVIDVSGSMAGSKLDYAKKSVLKLIDHLQPGDYCGLLTFASRVETLSAPVAITPASKDALKVVVGDLVARGGTNFSGGLLDALGHVNDMDLPNGVLMRVIMFTDGRANEGMARTSDTIVALLNANKGRASVSAFGYGSDADMDLLGHVAKAGDGNFAYIQNPDDALSAFAKELGGLLSTYAQNICVEVEPHGEHKVLDVVSDVDSEEKNGKILVKISDLLSEETRNLVFSIKVAKQPKVFPRASSVVDVRITYETIGADSKKVTHSEELKGKLLFVKPGEEDAKPIQEVMELAGTAILVQQQIAAEVQAKRGDYEGASSIMRSCGARLNNCGLGAHANVAEVVSLKVSSHGDYISSGGFLRSLGNGGTSAYHVSGYDAEAEGLLKGLHIETSNSSQDAVMGSFQSVDVDAAAVVLSSDGVVGHSDGALWKVSPEGALVPEVPEVKNNSKKKSERW